jgi:hypothetical protein
MSSFKVVSYFSPDYRDAAARLEKTLQRFEIEYELVAVPAFANWLQGVQFKPSFIRRCLEQATPERPIIWLDADATVEQYPEIFDDLPVDFAAHFRCDKRYTNELLSGTLFFRPTEGAFNLLDNWVNIQKADKEGWDQRTLQRAVETTHSYSLYRLPPNYTQIFDTMAYAGEPVILHHQASRGKDKTAQAVNMVGNPQ